MAIYSIRNLFISILTILPTFHQAQTVQIEYLSDFEYACVSNAFPVLKKGKAVLYKAGAEYQNLILDLNKLTIEPWHYSPYKLQFDNGYFYSPHGSTEIYNDQFKLMANGQKLSSFNATKNYYWGITEERQRLMFNYSDEELMCLPVGEYGYMGHNDKFLALRNEETNQLYVFDAKGQKRCEISNVKYASVYDNEHFLRVHYADPMNETEAFWDDYAVLYTFDGQEMGVVAYDFDVSNHRNFAYGLLGPPNQNQFAAFQGTAPHSIENLSCTYLRFLPNDLILFERGNAKGFADKNGKVLIEPQYRDIDVSDERWLQGIGLDHSRDFYDHELKLLRSIDHGECSDYSWEINGLPNLILFHNVTSRELHTYNEALEHLHSVSTIEQDASLVPQMAIFFGVPLEVVETYKKLGISNVFFTSREAYQEHNIIDLNQQRVLDRNYKVVKSLSTNLFLYGDDFRKLRLIKVSSL